MSPAVVAAVAWRDDARNVAAHLGVALWAGILGGLVIGGIGSRLAMFVLRVTTGPHVVGVNSDDGFTIGRVSSDTLFLLMFGAALGAAVGIVFLVTRPWIPARLRVPAFALLGGLVGGSHILHTHGIDFDILEPLWLAVAMFIVLPLVGGGAIAFLAERFLVRTAESERSLLLLLLPLLGLILLGPIGVLLVVLIPVGLLVNRWLPLAPIWTSPPVAWLGRAALLAWATVAAVALVNDVTGIFGW